MKDPLANLEQQRTQAFERGDVDQAWELQQTIDDLREATRCTDCRAIVRLEVMPVGDGYTSVWLDYMGGTLHFNPTGGLPLMTSHRVA